MQTLLKVFKSLSHQVEMAKWAMFFSLIVLLGALGRVLAFGSSADAAALSAAAAALLAALAVVLIADRQIVLESVRTTDQENRIHAQSMHQLVFLAKDLKGLIGYIRKNIRDGGQTVAILGIHTQIRLRYDQMCAIEVFRWLPGEGIDKLGALSPSIYGICTMVSETEKLARETGAKEIIANPQYEKSFEASMQEIQDFIDDVQALRNRLLD